MSTGGHINKKGSNKLQPRKVCGTFFLAEARGRGLVDLFFPELLAMVHTDSLAESTFLVSRNNLPTEGPLKHLFMETCLRKVPFAPLSFAEGFAKGPIHPFKFFKE